MVKQITIDSSVIVASLLDREKKHNECRNLLEKVKEDLCDINSIVFLDIISKRAHQAADIAQEIGVMGMDAIVIQTAREFNAPLVSLISKLTKRKDNETNFN